MADWTPQSRAEEILFSMINGEPYDGMPQSRIEELLLELKEVIESGGGGGGGGTTNYNLLSNKPKIAGTELIGNKTLAQLGIQSALTFDSEPTENSYNPVRSGGIFSTFAALRAAVNQQMDLKVDKIAGKGLSTNDYTTAEKNRLAGIEAGAEVNIIGEIVVNGVPLVPVNKSVAINLLTKAVDDLTNYYTKTQTYTKEEVNNLVNSISALTLDIVEELPTTDISTTTIYLVPVVGSTNVYMQYAYINDQWAQLGTTQVDLTNYYTKAQIDTYLNLKQDLLTFDSTPTANSDNPVTSGGIKTALDTKQDTLQLDTAPTENSTKFLNSGAIFTALLAKLAEAKAYTDEMIADFGGFEFYDSLEDITHPDTKTIYLIKDYTAVGSDKYREYVYKIVSGEGSFEQIGDTSITLSPATVSALGLVKPDGTSITIDTDGTIHAAAGVDFDEEDFVFDSVERLVSLAPKQRIFTGTQAEWDALPTAIKKTYGQANITDDESGTELPPDVYSTEEVKTNKVWIDDKPIYRKVISIPSIGNTVAGSSFSISFDRTGIKDVIVADTVLKNSSGNDYVHWGIITAIIANNISIQWLGTGALSYGYIVLEYTKEG